MPWQQSAEYSRVISESSGSHHPPHHRQLGPARAVRGDRARRLREPEVVLRIYGDGFREKPSELHIECQKNCPICR